ncbi:MAG: VRR-NUC domain-containing protein [Desulfobacula sp.]|nr:VRR-NUC domain-containing protein [Desulfobacula sp.]
MKKATKDKTLLEETEQQIIFKWIRANQIRYSKLQLAYGTLNGVRLAPKLRKKMYLQGNRKGVPDIVLPAKSCTGRYSGLYIELKRVFRGVVSIDQKRYMKLLNEQGYLALVCRGHAEAIELIKDYLGIKLIK